MLHIYDGNSIQSGGRTPHHRDQKIAFSFSRRPFHMCYIRSVERAWQCPFRFCVCRCSPFWHFSHQLTAHKAQSLSEARIAVQVVESVLVEWCRYAIGNHPKTESFFFAKSTWCAPNKRLNVKSLNDLFPWRKPLSCKNAANCSFSNERYTTPCSKCW